jgi:hypothetical protein
MASVVCPLLAVVDEFIKPQTVPNYLAAIRSLVVLLKVVRRR